MMRPSFTALLLALALSISLHAQEAGRSERYIESNWGVAIINPNSGVVFPGTSVLAGGRHFISSHGFVEAQGGLALPSILTAKLGGGKKWDSGWSLSTGIRVFPLHGYLQTGVPTSRCNRDLSERKERRLTRKGKTAADIKCSEWVFSLEISMLGLHEWFPSIKGKLTEAEYANRWYGPSVHSVGLITVGHRWLF